MSAEFTIKTATRAGVKPLIVLYAESGCGKTYSTLLFARGFVGADGQIVMIDTESGRGELYSDVIPGGYKVIPFSEPYSPQRYIDAITAVERSGAKIGIIDSGSHEWEGIGGVLDQAAKNEEESKRAGLHNWRYPKMEHAKMIGKLLQSPIPWIVCLRAKYKTRQGKDDKGRTSIIKDSYTSPIQSEEFIFEATAHGEIMPNHHLRLTKWSHPQLKACFPTDSPITVEHGRLVAEWCAKAGAPPKMGGGPPFAPKPAPSGVAALKKQLWDITAAKHRDDPKALQQYLWDEGILMDTEVLADLSESRLTEVIATTTKKLNP